MAYTRSGLTNARFRGGLAVANPLQTAEKPHSQADLNRSPRLNCCWSQGDAGSFLGGHGWLWG